MRRIAKSRPKQKYTPMLQSKPRLRPRRLRRRQQLAQEAAAKAAAEEAAAAEATVALQGVSDDSEYHSGEESDQKHKKHSISRLQHYIRTTCPHSKAERLLFDGHPCSIDRLSAGNIDYTG